MKRIILGLSLTLMATTAFAADAIVEEVAETAPVFSWTGGYIGLQGGYAWGDGSVVFEGVTDATLDPDGFIGGLYAGYNYQMPSNLVVGADFDISYADVNDTSPTPFPPIEAIQELSWTGAARLRLGYAVDRFLPYVAGGVAIGDVELSSTAIGNPSDSDTYVGWTIGAGLDYALTDNLIFRAEYRYTDFGSETLELQSGFPLDVDLSTNDVRFGIAYKF